jgi:hypothetical protein
VDTSLTIERLDNVDDPRLADYRALTDIALRLRTEPENGLFIAESALVIDRAVRAFTGARLPPSTGRRCPSSPTPTSGRSSGASPHSGSTLSCCPPRARIRSTAVRCG